ncbi:hypothetical protein ACA910_006482 [Epithemia clementina (nom. ined.)]
MATFATSYYHNSNNSNSHSSNNHLNNQNNNNHHHHNHHPPDTDYNNHNHNQHTMPHLSSLLQAAVPWAMVGLDLMRILSDKKHSGTFVCSLCGQLLLLDAFMTNHCLYAYCWNCLYAHVQQQVQMQQQEQQQQ